MSNKPVSVGLVLVAFAAACCLAAVQPTSVSAGPPEATPLVGISGMARLSDGALLVVHDTKHDERGPRVGVLEVVKDKPPRYARLALMNWARHARTHDVEAVCAIPGSPGEFVLCESGKDDDWRRLLRMRVERAGSRWKGTILKQYDLPADSRNIEGIVCLPSDASTGDLVVLLGERGGSSKLPQGMLRWTRLTPAGTGLEVFHEATLAAPDWPDSAKNRDCSDLYVDPAGVLWLAACEDPGDSGPFRSIIYSLGPISTLSAAATDGNIPRARFERRWTLDGVKVEALGPSPLEGSDMGFATDDEAFGGIWRPLPAE